ncbi:hypothetical protein BC629DRAFT_1525870 [Irpex lacteus]|nr:hypothetical protein BC629DRAFT_1525870 [Irpex lacteus]
MDLIGCAAATAKYRAACSSTPASTFTISPYLQPLASCSMDSMFSSQQDLASAAALFKNPVPTHGARRNTACQQCRKRNDTKRPCATCVRSHQYARTHPPEGVEVPEEVECTYGDEKEISPPSGSKVEKLESRIAELETLLQQMQVALEDSQRNAQSLESNLTTALHSAQSNAGPSSTTSPNVASQSIFNLQSDGSPWLENYLSQDVETPSSAFDSQYSYFPPSESSASTSLHSTPLNGTIASDALTTFTAKQSQLLLMGWPQGLPDPEVTRHLVHAFFAFHLHAGRLFHGPTFLASLDLPPTDPRFPFHGVLHAMCAIGSVYTADIPQPSSRPRMSFKTGGLGLFFAFEELFPGSGGNMINSQATLARIANEFAIDRGERLIECLQVQTMLTWFYHHQARGVIMRRPPNPASILEVPTSEIFWIAYVLERTQASGNIYAMTLDDSDICQLLPLRGDQFEQGLQIPTTDRQWSHDRSIFLIHPPNQTDSFILLTKANMLLSHVKNFNIRVRGRYFSGDPAVYPPYAKMGPGGRFDTEKWDPRDSPAFQELDHIATNFRQSFPNHLRNPIQDDVVDPYLFSTCSASFLAQVILHEPYADMDRGDCISRAKVLKPQGIATSYDVSLLDHLPMLAWNFAGRILIKAMKAAIDKNHTDDILIMHAEILYLHDMLAKAGERMPLPVHRYKKVIHDFLAGICGQQYVQNIQESPYYRKPRLSPPLNQVDMFNSMAFVENVYSPGTFAMNGVNNTPQM